MRAYVIQTNKQISPFQEDVCNMPVAGTTLGQWQKEILEELKIPIVLVSRADEIPADVDRLIFHDNVFFSRRGLRLFLKGWKQSAHGTAQFALPDKTLFSEQFSDLQDCRVEHGQRIFNIWVIKKDALIEDATPLEIDYKDRVEELPLPSAITGLEKWEHPITSSVCLHVNHWLHVLQINLLSIQIKWIDTIMTRPIWATWLAFRSMFGSPKNFRARIAQRANCIGKNVTIHPSAIVEGCIIGDNVEIGAQALVRGSLISEGVVLQERVNVAFSVIGPKSFVSKHSVVHACASFEEADMCMRGMQFCLVGRKAALTTRATPIDLAPGRKIRVDVDGEYVPIDMPMLGTCFGHEVFIGADVYTAPGRAIPNQIKVISDTSKILAHIPKDIEAGETYVVKNSSLEPLKKS